MELSKRDEFAKTAMHGLMAQSLIGPKELAHQAYDYADEMMRESIRRDGAILNSKSAVKSQREIIETVCKYYSVEILDVMHSRLNRKIVMVRNIACYLLLKYTSADQVNLTKVFGRSHTTVSKGLAAIKIRIKENSKIKNDVYNLIQLIEN